MLEPIERKDPTMIRSDPLIPPFSLVHSAGSCGGRFVWIDAGVVICERCEDVAAVLIDDETKAFADFDLRYSPISFSTS